MRSSRFGGIVAALAAVEVAACGASPSPTPSLAPDADAGAVVTAKPPQQPFHFDHRIHAGKYQIPCQTCHVYADHSTIAGIPTASKCMGCHRFVDGNKPDVKALAKAFEDRTPIVWNRVHRLPDHVFFNHERHVLHGVPCSRCHGAVETMAVVRQVSPLTMGWCVDCHRENQAPTDCWTCHK